jgi:hypothetical protein
MGNTSRSKQTDVSGAVEVLSFEMQSTGVAEQ